MFLRLNYRAIPVGILATAGLVFTHTAHAVVPANFELGPVFVAPTLDTEVNYTDNLLRNTEDKISTWGSKLTPRVEAWLQDGVNTYALSYKLVDYRYENSSSDNFTDQQANLDLHHEFNVKNVLNVFGEFYDGHEERGTGLTDGLGNLVDEPVEYERGTLGGDYTYGNTRSAGRLLLEAKRADYQYQNFRDVTRFRDRSEDTLGGTFFWGVGAKTDVLFQLRYIENQYDESNTLYPSGSFDSEEYNYMVGLSWDATAKVSGSIKAGAYEREYTSNERGNDDGFHWEVDLTYKPRTYSTINLGTRRYSQETNGFGNSINTEEYKLGWDHNWSSQSSTSLGFRFATESYEGTEREDDRFDLEASYKYAAKRWLDLGVGMRYEDRESDQNLFEYNRSVYFIEANFSL